MSYRIIERLRRFFKGSDDEWIKDCPLVHNFPNVGPDGQISIDCIVRPAARPFEDYLAVDKKLDGRVEGIAPKRVGALLVEIDEYGLRLTWKPAKLGDESFLSPFRCPPGGEPSAEPAKKRRGQDDVNELDDLDIHKS